MIKVFGYLKRKSGLSLQEFADHYEPQPRITRAEQGIHADGLQAQLHPAWGRLQHRR